MNEKVTGLLTRSPINNLPTDRRTNTHPANFRHYSRALRTLLSVWRAARASPEELARIQQRRLRRIVLHASQRVPYYRRLFQSAGIDPSNVKRIEDLKELKVTTKEDLRPLSTNEITAEGTDLARCFRQTTSGSTGSPFSIFWDEITAITFLAASVRAHYFIGSRLTDRILSIGPHYYPDALFFQKLGIARVKLISSTLLPQDILKEINSFQPDTLLTYPSVLKSLFPVLSSMDRIWAPRQVITSGELLDENTARRTEEFFGSRPFRFYGSWEMGRIGNECLNRTGIHLNEDHLIPELIPADRGVGTEGCYRLVLTNLYNVSMPFIRYDQGDLVRPLEGDCRCGSPFGRIEILDARASEMIHLPDGTSLSALRTTGILSLVPGIIQFKCIQESKSRLIVEIVKGPEFSETSCREAKGEMERMLPGIRVELQIVDRIPPDASGKTRRFESRVDQ